MVKILTIVKSYWKVITIFILSAITTLSLYPLGSLPVMPGSDKTHHFISYAVLMFPVALRKPNYYLFIGVFFVCWSGAIELIQPYVNRYGEWLDLAANTAGVASGLLIARILDWIFIVRTKTDHKNS